VSSSSSSSDKNLPEVSPRRDVSSRAGGGKAVLDAVARDALDVALRRAGKRYKVGEFELGEDSYQQVLIWAEVSGLGLEELIQRLKYDNLYSSRVRIGKLLLNGEFSSIAVTSKLPWSSKIEGVQNSVSLA
jgi:hypothetical protein